MKSDRKSNINTLRSSYQKHMESVHGITGAELPEVHVPTLDELLRVATTDRRTCEEQSLMKEAQKRVIAYLGLEACERPAAIRTACWLRRNIPKYEAKSRKRIMERAGKYMAW